MDCLGSVATEAELEAILRQLIERFPGLTLFFRGQTKLHPAVTSARSRLTKPPPPLIDTAWSAFASNALYLPAPDTMDGRVKAILQHYGAPTYFLDLSTSANVAAWFAVHAYAEKKHVYVGGAFRMYRHAWYERIQGTPGYLIVFGIKEPEALMQNQRLYDLSHLPSTFVRPKRQSAWLLMHRPPTRPDPNEFILGYFEVMPGFESCHMQADLFPGPSRDPCYQRLLDLPFAERPVPINEEGKSEMAGRDMIFAERVLDLPEYHAKEDTPNRKWTDIWVCEPTPMRRWMGWRFDLSTLHPPIQGDVRDTKKVTLSPTAKQVLDGSRELPLRWPELGADGLFFTYGGLDNDKFSDAAPPYHGVWLQRHEDLIVETPMESSDDALSVMPGHVFQFSNGKLARQETANGCKCGFPETHEERVAATLRLSSAVAAGKVLLIPHPRIETMFVAFTERDMDSIAADLSSSKRMHRAIMERLKEAKPKGSGR